MSLVAGELRKVFTTRTVLWFALVSVLLAGVNVAVVGLASGTLDEAGEKQEALGGMPVLLLLFGVVAAAGEYRHRTVAPAVLATGRDPRALLVARLSAHAVVGLALATLMTGTAFALGVPILATRHPGPDLTVGQLTELAGGCLLAGVLSVLLGAAAGTALRSQVAGLVGAVVVAFLVTPMVGMMDESAVDYTPFGSVEVLTRAAHGPSHSLIGAGVALTTWVLVVVAVSCVLERRRDLA